MRIVLVAVTLLIVAGCAAGFTDTTAQQFVAGERSDPAPQAAGGGGM